MTSVEVDDETFYPKSRKEAKRWLEQSKSDLACAKWLLEAGPSFNAQACFHCHEVVEKCLKAMLYYFRGISGKLRESHKVQDLVRNVSKEITTLDDTVKQSVTRVAEYYLSTRYPNCQPSHIVPARAFKEKEAHMAVDAASKILTFVEEDCFKE